MTTQCTADEARLAEESFQRIAGDLAMIADRTIELVSFRAERATQRVAGRATVHVSFKLGFQQHGEIVHGALVVPLAEAITLGCYLMMVPDDGVKSKRALHTLDPGLKDALMEVGNFVGGATDAALRGLGIPDIKVRSEGCQGVKANVRPAFTYAEGAPLIVATAKLRIHSWPAFDALLMLPVLATVAPTTAAS